MMETNTNIPAVGLFLFDCKTKARLFSGPGVGTVGKAPKPFIPGKEELDILTITHLYDKA